MTADNIIDMREIYLCGCGLSQDSTFISLLASGLCSVFSDGSIQIFLQNRAPGTSEYVTQLVSELSCIQKFCGGGRGPINGGLGGRPDQSNFNGAILSANQCSSA